MAPTSHHSFWMYFTFTWVIAESSPGYSTICIKTFACNFKKISWLWDFGASLLDNQSFLAKQGLRQVAVVKEQKRP